MRRLRTPHRLAGLATALAAVLLVSGGAAVSQAGVGFTVSATTSVITGQDGKMLVLSATPVAGGQTTVACTPINGPVFQTPVLNMREMPQSGNPCEPGTPDAFMPAGMTTITAGVYVGGSQTADKQVSATVDVQQDWTWVLDGVALTPDTVGDADCNRTANAVDALNALRHVAGLSTTAACLSAANVKCDDALSAVDALFILRHVAALPLNVPQGCPSPFAAPVLVSPDDGAHLEESGDWHADLDWEPVAGAAKYMVEVDITACAGVDFCSQMGLSVSPVAVVANTAYKAQLVGANLERWRVFAINDDGTPGDFSQWRTFDIDVVPAASH